MLHKSSITLLSSAFAAVATTTSANAFSVTLGGRSVPGQGVFSSVPGATTIDFEYGAPTSGPVVYSNPIVVSGSRAGLYAAPNDDRTKYLTVGSFTSSVTITLARLADYFGLYVGSPDPYNGIAFYNGSNLIKPHWGFNGTGAANSLYINFFAAPGEYFNKISIFSSSPAAETDNHAYRFIPSQPPSTEVPEPLKPPSTEVPEPLTCFGGVLGLGAIVAARKIRSTTLD